MASIFVDVVCGAGFDFVGELFDGVGAGDGIDGVGRRRFRGR